MTQLLRGRRRTGMLVLALLASSSLFASVVHAQVRPRFLIAFDTSGSMGLDFNGIPTYGDGSTSTGMRGIDTNCDGAANDSRIYIAKQVLTNTLLAFGDVDSALESFDMYSTANADCNQGSGTIFANDIRINDYECNVAPGVSSFGDPSLNNGALLTHGPPGRGNCGGNWGGLTNVLPTDPIPAACRPAAPRLWATGSPTVCVDFVGLCP